jgi:hypothetical protein
VVGGGCGEGLVDGVLHIFLQGPSLYIVGRGAPYPSTKAARRRRTRRGAKVAAAKGGARPPPRNANLAGLGQGLGAPFFFLP